MGRTSKHAPQEVSSKRPVSVLREVIAPVRRRAIDPRFDRAFGNFNKDLFEKSFDFLADMQKDELQQLRHSLRKEQHPARREGLQRTLQRLTSMHETRERTERRQKLVREHRRAEAQLVEQGKKLPYHLTQRDLKNLELVQEFEEHQQRGGTAVDMDRFIEKRRKRRASKQRRFMPEEGGRA